MSRILLILTRHSYRAGDFLRAADRLGVEVVVAVDGSQAFTDVEPPAVLSLDLANVEGAVARIVEIAAAEPFDAIVAAEDEGTVVAAAASAALSLPHNPPGAVAAARYKHLMRERLAAAGVRCPRFRVFATHDEPEAAARRVRYPCVLKPVLLAASRGVIRADGPADFVRAFRRIARILEAPDVVERRDRAAELILAEDYVAGSEVALEGVLTAGELKVLALFDKPDPLEGPHFEETLYVTPSRLPSDEQRAVAETVAAGARALGLRHGPVHAEARINDDGVWPLEIAPRSIGGLCSRTLRFGAGLSLEELILRHAVGGDVEGLARERRAAGVLMIPIPCAGTLREVRGLEDARSVPGVEGVEITIAPGERLVPPPEGHRYLGFIFARASTPEAAESALREAHRRLEPLIEPDLDAV